MADTFREFGKGLIDPKYCCCAVPLVNFGIYAIMGEQLLVGIGIGVAALSTPKVLGASFPSFATYIFAICCFIIGGLQPVGFIGVMREKTKTFKTYIWLNLIALIAAFVTSGALIVVSALNHSQAVNSCLTNFFKPKPNATSSAVTMLQQQGPLICGPFAWASIGIMGGLWVLFLLLQGYFMYLTKGYSSSQVKDHKLYHSVYSENPEAFTMSILQSKRYNPNSIYSANPGPGPSGLGRPATLMRDDTWDARGSGEMDRHGASADEIEALQHQQDQHYQQGYGHQPEYSQQAYDQQYNNAYGTPQQYHSGHRQEGYGDEGRYEDAYAHAQQYDQRQSAYGGAHGYGYGGGGVEQPAEARYGREPGPTPELNQYSAGQGVGFAGGAGGLSRPGAVQNHPAEGMFGRKSPRGYQ